MRILIVKHYWDNGENATWEYHPKIDKKLFQYLKENYHKFVQERNIEIENNGYFIYPCYEHTKDKFERDITNITFFVSKSKVTENLCQQQYNNLELKIKGKNDNRIILFGIISISIFLATIIFLLKSETKESATTNDRTISATNKYDSLKDEWNKVVQNFTENKYYFLNRESPSKLTKQLNGFIEAFYKEFENSNYEKYQTEHNKSITDIAYIITSHKKYISKNKKYITENNITQKKITEDMSINEIEKYLEELTNQDNMFDIVQVVLKMNDINIFLLKK